MTARSVHCKCHQGFTCGHCLRNAKPYHFTPSSVMINITGDAMTGRYHYQIRSYGRRYDGARTWTPTDFQRGAIEAAFFTAHPIPSSGEFDMDWHDWNSLSESDRVRFIETCERFERRYEKLLTFACEACEQDMQAAGRDYHYTSQGHGVGFWDGDWRTKNDCALPSGRVVNAGRDFGRLLELATERHKLPELHGDTSCPQQAACGEACGNCDECEKGISWWLE